MVLYNHEKKERKRTFTVGVVTAGILMIPAIVCLICNIAIGHALDWFFIVLASLLLAASITTVPLVVRERKGVWTICGFTASLLLLLLVCCIYTRGNWFLVAAVSCIFGLSVFLMPYVICNIPLPKTLQNKKGLLTMLWDTLWLYLLIIICGIFVRGGSFYWRISLSTATWCVLIPWAVFLVVRYMKAHVLTKTGLIVIIVGAFGALADDVVGTITGEEHWSILQADFRNGFAASDLGVFNANIMMTVLIVSLLLGGLMILIGLFCGRGNK